MLVQVFVFERIERKQMAAPKKIVVQKRDDGKFAGKRPGGERASVVRDTQYEAIDASREVSRRVAVASSRSGASLTDRSVSRTPSSRETILGVRPADSS
jgi:hypothetical protein